MAAALLSVSETADHLGVSTRQVQNLVADGVLHRVVRGYVDASSVDQLLAVRGRSHRRAWSEQTAWAAVALLSGSEPTWLGQTQRSRLRARLRGLAADELVERTRGRAIVRRFAGHPSALTRLRQDLAETVTSTRGLGLADADGVDAYVDAGEIDGLVRRYALREDASGNIVLRGTSMDTDLVAALLRTTDVAVALDLAGSTDSRARGVGLKALDEALQQTL